MLELYHIRIRSMIAGIAIPPGSIGIITQQHLNSVYMNLKSGGHDVSSNGLDITIHKQRKLVVLSSADHLFHVGADQDGLPDISTKGLPSRDP